MSDRLRDARLTASDRDGLTEVTIDATGRLVARQVYRPEAAVSDDDRPPGR